ncbi:recombinase family protein [Streptomonospora sp. PA3]|uniref:recombinase family protein n=1 Tax=Streptomonospora sp. PA3 TaxID=2607326 RepID=UPI0016432A30|nr:recombinase family protein [Streptomonospora sp. PA3]
MRYGYARVSTEDQSLDRQCQQLADCDRVITDEISGSVPFNQRPGGRKLLNELVKGDELVIVSLDRLGRSTGSLLVLIDELNRAGITLRSLREDIDTGSATGRVMVGMLSVFAQFERDRTSERTKEGLAAARQRGVRLGKPPRVPTAEDRRLRERYRNGASVAELVAETGLSRATVYRRLRTSLPTNPRPPCRGSFCNGQAL